MTRKVKFLLFLLLAAMAMLLVTCKPIAYYLQQAYKAHGTVIDAGTRVPLESVEVFLSPYQYSVLTNGLGDYGIELAEGTWTLEFVKDGYVTVEKVVKVNAANPREKVDVELSRPRQLVAEYLFSGSAVDTSGNGHDGVVNNAIATSDRFGKPNTAYYFDNSYVEVSDPPGHLFSLNYSFSISGWLNLASDSAWVASALIAQDEGGGSNNKWILNHNTDSGTLDFHVNSPSMGGMTISSDPIALQPGTWHHVALVRDGVTFKFYVDSLAAGNVTSDVVIPEVNSPLRIGYAEETIYLIGSADDIRIYNYALTAEEVSALFHEGGWTGQ